MVAGNIWVVNSPSILACFPTNLKRDNAYPAVDARTTPVTVTTKETIVEFQTHNKNGLFLNNSMYCLKVALSGIIESEVDSRLSFGLIDIVNTFITGYKATTVKMKRNKYVSISASNFFLFIF